MKTETTLRRADAFGWDMVQHERGNRREDWKRSKARKSLARRRKAARVAKSMRLAWNG